MSGVRFRWSALFLISASVYAGPDRSEIETLPAIELVRLATPPVAVKTFARRLAEVSPGLITGAVASAEQLPETLAPPVIPDFGAIVAERLNAALPARVSWWPKMAIRPDPVDVKYVHADFPWLRVWVKHIQIAASGRILTSVEVRLSAIPGKSLWSDTEHFSGLINGGEKIDMDILFKDQSQIRREMERAADHIVGKIIDDLPRK